MADDTNNGTSSQETIVAASESEGFFQPLEVGTELHSESVILEQLVTFSHSIATISGTALFGGLLDRCTIYNETYSHQKDFIHLILNDTASAAVRVCLCHDNVMNYSYQPGPFIVKKGETFIVQAVAVDQVNYTLSTNIHSYLSHRLSHLHLGPGQQVQMANSSGTNLTFQVSSPKDNEELNLYADGPCGNKGISNLKVKVNFLPCTCPVSRFPAIKREGYQ